MALSSSLTFMIRTLLPASWALALPAVLLVSVPAEFEHVRRVFVLSLSILLLQSAVWFVRLKDVHSDQDGLVISDGRVSARVSWGQVAAIEKPWWGKDGFARLELRSPTRFGSTVLFMLSVAPFTRWAKHPSVQTVTEHIGTSRPQVEGVDRRPGHARGG